MIRRRSWFESRPWWHLTGFTFVATLAAGLVTTTALDADPRPDFAFLVLMAGGIAGAGALAGGWRGNRSWQELSDDWPDEPAELKAAEEVVRFGAPPASELQLLLAQRIADLRWREIGGYWTPGLLAVLAAALTVMGALTSPWWFVLAISAGGTAMVIVMVNRPLAHRRADLASFASA